MLRIKKIDLYLLRTFLSLLVLTLFICVFILLMQFVWARINDLVGKGIEVKVLAEFFVYAVANVLPLSLPLAVLLASLMSFGNLGEKFELTAMKAAGISLFRIMRPLAIAVCLIAAGLVLFSNYVLPGTQVKLWTLVFSMRSKTPEMDIPQGEFYSGVHGYNIYVRNKNVRTGMLYDMMIYDYSKGFRDAAVMVADSGQIFFTGDKKYLLLSLYNGESFENLNEQQQRATRSMKNIPYRRETFGMKNILIDFDTELNRMDEDILRDQHVAKDIAVLVQSIDSARVLMNTKTREQSAALIAHNYLGRERMNDPHILPMDSIDNISAYSIACLYSALPIDERAKAIQAAIDKARAKSDLIEYNALVLEDQYAYIRKHEVELHRKFTLAFACVIFFFIGAPLGAIIRKGGLGAPVVISVVMFIIYYIIDNIGFKMAREAVWPVWQGMWLSSLVLLPIGIFLTWKAATDSGLFRTEVWFNIYNKMIRYATRRYNNIKTKLFEHK